MEKSAGVLSYVRSAQWLDAAALSRIDASVSDFPWSLAQFDAVCSDDAAAGVGALVLQQADHLNGFVVIAQVLDEASIRNIAVREGLQGQGFGRRLCEAALLQLQEAGAVRCLLEVRKSNTAALGLYQAMGFEVDSVRKLYYRCAEGREDALLMSLTF